MVLTFLSLIPRSPTPRRPENHRDKPSQFVTPIGQSINYTLIIFLIQSSDSGKHD